MATIHKRKYKTCTRWEVHYSKAGHKGTFKKVFTSPRAAARFASEVETPLVTEKLKGWGYVS